MYTTAVNVKLRIKLNTLDFKALHTHTNRTQTEGGPQHPPYQNAQAPSMPKWLSTIQLPSFVAATMAVWAQISAVWHTTRPKVGQAGQTKPMPQSQQLFDGVHGGMISIWGPKGWPGAEVFCKGVVSGGLKAVWYCMLPNLAHQSPKSHVQ